MTKEHSDALRDSVLRFREARHSFLIDVLKAVVLPLWMPVSAYWIKGIMSHVDALVPVAWLDTFVVVAWIVAGLGIMAFTPRMVGSFRALVTAKGILNSQGIQPVWLEVPHINLGVHELRQMGHMALAMGIAMLGFFIEGSLGSLLRTIGLVGVVFLALMMVFTGDVVIGARKDGDG